MSTLFLLFRGWARYFHKALRLFVTTDDEWALNPCSSCASNGLCWILQGVMITSCCLLSKFCVLASMVNYMDTYLHVHVCACVDMNIWFITPAQWGRDHPHPHFGGKKEKKIAQAQRTLVTCHKAQWNASDDEVLTTRPHCPHVFLVFWPWNIDLCLQMEFSYVFQLPCLARKKLVFVREHSC